jgi:CRP-like cAMP-binding protein
MDTSLFRFLNGIKPLNATEMELLQTCILQRTFPARHIIQREGVVSDSLHFIVKGSIRAYHLQDGSEIHRHFFLENTFAADMESITSGNASDLFLETLEPTEVVTINRFKMIGLYEQAPVFESIGRNILEQLLAEQHRYARLFTDHTPAGRYAYTEQHHPGLIKRIPLQFLASYLGMARETLSRIRSKRTS